MPPDIKQIILIKYECKVVIQLHTCILQGSAATDIRGGGILIPAPSQFISELNTEKIIKSALYLPIYRKNKSGLHF